MKKRDFVKSFLATRVAHIFLAPVARAGSVGGFGGSTELTQLANNVELVNSYIQQAQAYVTQLDQYRNMIQNTLNIPNQVWGMVMNELSGVANLVKQGQALALSCSRILVNNLLMTFKGFQFPSGFDFQTDYKKWSQTTLDSLKGALESANLQAQQFATEEGRLEPIAFYVFKCYRPDASYSGWQSDCRATGSAAPKAAATHDAAAAVSEHIHGRAATEAGHHSSSQTGCL